MPANRLYLLLIVLVSSTLLAQPANPIPTLYQPLVPTSVEPGSRDLTLTLRGTGFVSTSVVKWNGIALQTAFISPSKLVADVPASDVASRGTASITVFSPAPGGGTSNAVPFTIARPTNSVSFTTSTINVGLAPGSIRVADFNHDGKADLAVMNDLEPAPECYPFGGRGTISILLGNGDGTFSSAASLCFPGIFSQGESELTVTDLNGDGNLDLIARYFADGEGYVIFYGNGDGTFTMGYSEDGWDGMGSIAAADFDADGKMDLAIPEDSFGYTQVLVVLGNGSQTFFRGWGNNAAKIAAADFTNDGNLDLIWNGGEIAVGQGGGTFTTAVIDGFPQVGNLRSMTIADFDGDGNLDFAIANEYSNDLLVLRGHGDGTFTLVNGEPPLQLLSNDVTMADLNGDGKLDLVFSDSCSWPCTANTVEVFLGNGDGTFQPGFSESVGNGPVSVAVGDFNGDGRLDIAVANYTDNTVSILLQSAARARVSLTLNSSLNPSYVGQPVTFSVAVSGGASTPTGSVAFKYGSSILATVPLVNGQASFTTAFPENRSFPIVASYSGDGNFRPKNSRPLRQVVQKYPTATTLTSSPNPAAHGQGVTFTATVNSAGPTPTGKVTFKDDGKSLSCAPLINGVATIARAQLPAGNPSITATYEGDAESAKSTSPALVPVVN